MPENFEVCLDGNKFYGIFGIVLELIGYYLLIDVNLQTAIGVAFCISANKVIKRGFNNA